MWEVVWAGDGSAEAMMVYAVSSRRAFIQSVESAFVPNPVSIFQSSDEALECVTRSDRPRMHMVVIDLTTALAAERLIHFLKWASPTRHVVIIGVGDDGDFAALAPDALQLLDRAVKWPVTPIRLAMTAAAAGLRPLREVKTDQPAVFSK